MGERTNKRRLKMKRLMCCLLLSMCAFAAQAQNIPDTITLFGYTLKCDGQVVGKKGELGRRQDALKINCSLPNETANNRLHIDITTFGVEAKPTIQQMENILNKISGKEDEKYTFSCPGTNNIVGGHIHSSSFPSEFIILDTPTFTASIDHTITQHMFSSKSYLNQLCQWKPW